MTHVELDFGSPQRRGLRDLVRDDRFPDLFGAGHGGQHVTLRTIGRNLSEIPRGYQQLVLTITAGGVSVIGGGPGSLE